MSTLTQIRARHLRLSAHEMNWYADKIEKGEFGGDAAAFFDEVDGLITTLSNISAALRKDAVRKQEGDN